MSARDLSHSPPVLDFFSADSNGPREQQHAYIEYGDSSFQPKLTTAQVSLSLKTRETSALALKHIFDQISSGDKEAGARNQGFPYPLQTASVPENVSDNVNNIPFEEGYLPRVVSRPNFSSALVKPPTAQLTIFYSGTVNVYNDVPADKANAIMLLAGTGNPCYTSPANEADRKRIFTQITSPSPPPQPVTPDSGVTSTGTQSMPFSVPCSANIVTNNIINAVSTPPPASPLPSFQSDSKPQPGTKRPAGIELPHARKASLARFLEKRRDRVNVKTPQAGTEGKTDIIKDERASSPKKQCLLSRNESSTNCSLPLTANASADTAAASQSR